MRLLWQLVPPRGAWLANVAGLLAILGISTIPGFLMIDFVDSAIGRIAGVYVALRVSESAMAFWGFFVMQIPGLVGLLLALPLAAIAAWRAGLLPWWGVMAVIVGEAAFFGFNVTLIGNVLHTIAFAVLSVSLAKIDPAAWHTPGTEVWVDWKQEPSDAIAQPEPAAWVFYLPLPPLFLLLFTGLYLLVLPYTARWRSGRRTDEREAGL